MYIHGSFEVPDIRRKPIFVPKDYLLQVYVKALTIISSEDTRKLRIRQRKCRFFYESNLKHFPVYSYGICRMECRIRLAINLCGCVPHFYKKLGKTQFFDQTMLENYYFQLRNVPVMSRECIAYFSTKVYWMI